MHHSTDLNLKRAKQAFVFCCLILFINFCAFLIIISSDRLRRKPKFHIIISMCVLNICSCMTYFPLSINQTLHPVHIGIGTLSFLQTTGYFVSPAILGMSITVVDMEHLMNRTCSGLYSGNKILVSILGIVLPWAYGLVAYLPCLHQQLIIGESFYQMQGAAEGNYNYYDINGQMSNRSAIAHETNVSLTSYGTFYTFTKTSIVTVLCFWGIFPVVAVAGVGLSASCLMCFGKKEGHAMGSIALEPSCEPDDVIDNVKSACIIDMLITALVYVVGNSPFLFDLINILRCDSDGLCFLVRSTDYTCAILRWTVAFVLPTVWLLDIEVREAVVEVWGRFCSKHCIVY